MVLLYALNIKIYLSIDSYINIDILINTNYYLCYRYLKIIAIYHSTMLQKLYKASPINFHLVKDFNSQQHKQHKQQEENSLFIATQSMLCLRSYPFEAKVA